MTVCSPQVASGPFAALGYQEETCLGQLPAVPELKTCRRRSTTIGLEKETYDSEEVRSDRMVSDSRHGIRTVGGDIVTEISPGSHADFYEALLGGVWTAPAATAITAANITTLDNVIVTFDGVGDMSAAGAYTGSIFTVTGTGNAAVDGHKFQIIGIQPLVLGGSLTARPINAGFEYLLLPLALATGTLTAQPQVTMNNIYRSFVFERAFADIGSFIQYTGNRFNSAAIDLPATGIATSTFTLMGKDALPITGASYDGIAEVVLTDIDVTSLTFDAILGTITAAAGDFVAAGFVAGDRVIFDGDGITDPQNRNPRTVIAVTPTVLTVAEAIQTGGPYTAPLTITKVGLPDYTQAPDDSVLVAVSGAVMYRGQVAGTVTAMNLNIDNQMAGSQVVGQNVVPVNLYGNQCIVGGNMTVLFDRGGIGEQAYNDFDGEGDDISIMITLVGVKDAAGSDVVSFVMPRCKINTGTIGDAVAEGLPVACDYRALKPHAERPEDGVSQVMIVDTSVVGAVAPFAVMSAAPGTGAGSTSALAPKSAPKAGSGSGVKADKKDGAKMAIAAE